MKTYKNIYNESGQIIARMVIKRLKYVFRIKQYKRIFAKVADLASDLIDMIRPTSPLSGLRADVSPDLVYSYPE